jgi:ABC-2 type transport system permease protein
MTPFDKAHDRPRQAQGERLPLLQAAWVIARRDFTAILFSRSFIFFLLGPLFPLVVGALAGGIGQRVESTAAAPKIGIAMQAADVDRMLAARETLAGQLGQAVPKIEVKRRLGPGETYDAAGVLERREGNLAAIITGTPAAPVLTATGERLQWWSGIVGLIAATAEDSAPAAYPRVSTREVAASGASDTRGRMRTAQAGQIILFLLTMLLAGMVLSNLVEEKANKIIEILAAAIPMDAVFLGKLFAMLAISLVGICVWATVIGGAMGLSGFESMFGGAIALDNLPQPGVGWPLFFALGVAYFAMAYLLLGAVFLAIGSLASTVREVQTLSMPVTMMQVFLFLFATLAVSDRGGWLEWTAMAFPFSSPFAMLARAAQEEALWPHAAALLWQAAWVTVSIKFGAALFRKRVMKSGPQGKSRKRARRVEAGASVVAGGAPLP